MANRQIIVTLSDEALAYLDNEPKRKKSRAIDMAVLAWYEGQPAQDKPANEPGILERIEQRLARIEAALAGGNVEGERDKSSSDDQEMTKKLSEFDKTLIAAARAQRQEEFARAKADQKERDKAVAANARADKRESDKAEAKGRGIKRA